MSERIAVAVAGEMRETRRATSSRLNAYNFIGILLLQAKTWILWFRLKCRVFNNNEMGKKQTEKSLVKQI